MTEELVKLQAEIVKSAQKLETLAIQAMTKTQDDKAEKIFQARKTLLQTCAQLDDVCTM